MTTIASRFTDLTPEERDLLLRVLRRDLDHLLHEIHHTTYDRVMRQGLQRDASVLEGLIARLGG